MKKEIGKMPKGKGYSHKAAQQAFDNKMRQRIGAKKVGNGKAKKQAAKKGK